MAKGVQQALLDIFEEEGDMDVSVAELFVRQLLDNRRYLLDIWS
jgi:sulfite reductase alpha subunit-like flavoprotein